MRRTTILAHGATFDMAVASAHYASGVGFVLSEGDIVAFHLDSVATRRLARLRFGRGSFWKNAGAMPK